MGKNSNPKQLKALLYAYQNPVPQVNFDYRQCTWYQEGKIVVSEYNHVIAYKDGYRCRFTVQVYEFHNVPNTRQGKDKLVTYVKNNPAKYKGWLHHINLYRQSDNGKGKCIEQIKL